MIFRTCIAAVMAFAALIGSVNAAQDVKSPDEVRYALQLLMHITNDFNRQIDRKTFARISHENEEFIEGSGALRKAIASDPGPFKAEVETALQAAIKAAQDVADKSGSNDEAVLRSGHAEMLKKVNAVFALFPESLRPEPNFMFSRKPAAAPPASPAQPK